MNLTTRIRLHWFDLRHGLPTAIRVLQRHLGLLSTIRVLLSFVWGSISSNPYTGIAANPRNPDAPLGPREHFTRHQLRPVLILDRALRNSLKMSQESALTLLTEVVAESGSRFIATQLKHPTEAQWKTMTTRERRGFTETILARFQNAEAEIITAPEHDVAFDVSFCHFVGLTHRLGRPDLAPLFCGADQHYYESSDNNITLVRQETLAQGDARCAFRFAFGDTTVQGADEFNR